MKFKEVEFKYRADDVSLTAFNAFCKDRLPLKTVIASGYDHFYENRQSEDSFCRHRVGPDMNQLTFKRKTTAKNSYIRTEHNLDLGKKMTEAQTEAFCAEFGYVHNVSIFKTCFVYKYDLYTLVYYICYDMDQHELGRFLEIEVSEEHPWESEAQAYDALVHLETACANLGISPQRRLKTSLFEMYKK